MLSMSKTAPTLPPSKRLRVLGDQQVDEAAWLAARRKLLTASDFYSWVDLPKPKWWSTSRDDIIEEKRTGKARVFGSTPLKQADTARAMAWGRQLEVPYLEAFCGATGLPSSPLHALLGNDRWPGLGATLDAVAVIPAGDGPLEVETELFSRPDMVLDALETVMELGGTGIIEIKSTNPYSFKKTWLERVPEYYEMQPRIQMAIAEVDWCLIVCGSGQDMTAHAITRDEDFDDFEGLMDDVCEEFQKVMEDL